LEAAVDNIKSNPLLLQDTENLIKRFNYDEYIWASVMLYIDVINLFINLLALLRETQESN
jgi:FtsH-binding integral membrane protein